MTTDIRHHRTCCTTRSTAHDQLLVNQHTYGIPAARAPVFCLSNTGSSEMSALYLDSCERVWASAVPLA